MGLRYSRRDYEMVADKLHRTYDAIETGGFGHNVEKTASVAVIMFLALEFADEFERQRTADQNREFELAEKVGRPHRVLPKFDRQKFIDRVRDGYKCGHSVHAAHDKRTMKDESLPIEERRAAFRNHLSRQAGEFGPQFGEEER